MANRLDNWFAYILSQQGALNLNGKVSPIAVVAWTNLIGNEERYQMTKLNFERLRVHSRLSQDRRIYGPITSERLKNVPPMYGPLPSSRVFRGDYETLRKLLRRTGLDGTWSEAPGTVKVYRTEEGGIMNWAESTGTMWFQGKQPYVQDLYEAVLRQCVNRPSHKD